MNYIAAAPDYPVSLADRAACGDAPNGEALGCGFILPALSCMLVLSPTHQLHSTDE